MPVIGVHVVSVASGNSSAALTALKADPSVAFAERDQLLEAQEQLPNDPYFYDGNPWALYGGAWGWHVTHTTRAWDITAGDPNVPIAILDDGIQTAGLDDFDGQIGATWNVLNNSTDVTSTAGTHGTEVAGVAGLAIGNGVGNAGYCPRCRLMIVQVGTASDTTYVSNLASGLIWAADHGARVANMSWAGSSDSSTMRSATTYAHSKGVVMFAAAGNSNCNCVSYPAADPYVLGVAGVANDGVSKSYDSNYGNWVELAAPEGDLTAWPSINGAPGYAQVGGTSVASPAAAGIAGLLFSYNRSLTNTQVEQALESSATPINFTVQYGRIDALAALEYLGASDPQPASGPVQVAPAQLYYESNNAKPSMATIAPLVGAPQVGQVLVRGLGAWAGSASLTVTGLQWQRCDPGGSNCLYLANGSTYTVQSPDAGFAIKLVFSVKNGYGSVPVSVLTQPVGGWASSSPTSTSSPVISGTAQEGQTLTASTGSWSGSPTSYAYQWERCDGSGAACAAIAGATSSSYVVQTTDVGSTLRVAVTASNNAGSATAVSAPTAVVASAPPNPPPTIRTLTFSGSLNPKNPSRSFSVTVGAGGAHAELSFAKCSSLTLALSTGANVSGPSVVVLDAILAAGTYTYTVSGGRCSFTLTVAFPSP